MSRVDEYDYHLPKERIAQYPLACRTDARMMVVDRRMGTLTHAHVRDLPDFLRPSDAVVINDTRVIPARLVGYRTRTRGHWDGLFLSVSEEGLWRILGRTRGRLQIGETVTLRDRRLQDACRLTMVAKLGGGEWAARPDSNEPPLELLERIGRVPLPGYIRGGEMVDADPVTYQTVFATQPGAVAAPTAGLHFTQDLLRRLEAKGVGIERVTLHVGLGTFRPISAPTLDEHVMHAEWGRIDAPTVDRLLARRAAGGRIVAVGTTAVRTLETAALKGTLTAWQGETDLFIRPGHTFRAVDAVLTNFHLPRSTLLVLVRTFGGDQLIQSAYRTAIREEYRFYSYGDAMLIV
jgi:S-adenosylmethionine:tRNA ribosyltransferase-isomerase